MTQAAIKQAGCKNSPGLIHQWHNAIDAVQAGLVPPDRIEQELANQWREMRQSETGKPVVDQSAKDAEQDRPHCLREKHEKELASILSAIDEHGGLTRDELSELFGQHSVRISKNLSTLKGKREIVQLLDRGKWYRAGSRALDDAKGRLAADQCLVFSEIREQGDEATAASVAKRLAMDHKEALAHIKLLRERGRIEQGRQIGRWRVV